MYKNALRAIARGNHPRKNEGSDWRGGASGKWRSVSGCVETFSVSFMQESFIASAWLMLAVVGTCEEPWTCYRCGTSRQIIPIRVWIHAKAAALSSSSSEVSARSNWIALVLTLFLRSQRKMCTTAAATHMYGEFIATICGQYIVIDMRLAALVFGTDQSVDAQCLSRRRI